MNEKKDKKVTIRFTPNEYRFIKAKADIYSFKSVSQYVRFMLSNGAVVLLDTAEIRNALKDISGIARNVNQIAVRANATGNIYKQDLDDIRLLLVKINNAVVDISVTLKNKIVEIPEENKKLLMYMCKKYRKYLLTDFSPLEEENGGN